MFKAATRLLSLPPLKSSVRYKNNSFKNFIKNRPQTKFTVLDNCLTVASQDTGTQNICIGAYIDAGSRYENTFERGITHFFEHIAFSGTQTQSKEKIHEMISCCGATFRCFTTREMAVYYVECLSESLQPMLYLLADILLNNKYADIEYQKSVVYAEMLDGDKDPETVLMDYLHQSAYQGTDLAENVIGRPDNLHKFDEATMTRYLSRKFVPERMVLVVVGGVEHERIMNLIQASKFATILPVKCRQCSPTRYTGSQILYRDDSMPKAHIAMAFEAPSFCHSDKLAIDLLATYIGSWDKKQYSGINHCHELARNIGMSDSYDAYKTFNITYRDTGLFGLYYLAKTTSLENVIHCFQAEVLHLCHTVSDEELVYAKQELISSILYKNMCCVPLCHKIGYTIMNCICDEPLYEQIKKIKSIDAAEVRKVSSKYFYDTCPVVVGVGPTEGLPDYTRLRSSMYWLRV